MASPQRIPFTGWRLNLLGALLMACALASVTGAVQAQSIQPIGQAGRFYRIFIEQGMPQGNVTQLLQDRRGFIWIGTQVGLLRYDGYDFRSYLREPSTPDGLSDNWIWTLFEDGQGQLWVGTRSGGLNRFDPATQRFTAFHHDPQNGDSLPSNDIRAVAGGQEGTLWLGSSRGLVRFDVLSGRSQRVRSSAPAAMALLQEAVVSMATDNQGGVWVGTTRGLLHVAANGADIEVFVSDPADPDSLPDNRISALFVSRNGLLWVGREDGGVATLVPGGRAFVERQGVRNPAVDNAITSIAEDAEGNLWLGTFSAGLRRIEPRSGRIDRHYHDPNDPKSLSDSRISALLADSSGTLWVGTWNRGLNLLDLVSPGFGRLAATADPHAKFNTDQVYSVTDDGAGGLWVGTLGGGLSHVEASGEQVRVYRHDPADPRSLSHDLVRSVYRDRSGTLWVGTHEGLDRLLPDGVGFQHHPQQSEPGSGSGDDVVRAMLEDSRGQFWMGTENGGLKRLDRGSGDVRVFRQQPDRHGSISSNDINEVFEDQRGRLWVGTQGGLNLFDPQTETFRVLRHDPADPHSLSSDRVSCVFQDSRQRIWVGTGDGLNRLLEHADGSFEFTSYGTANGLAASAIGAVQEDADGGLWISTTMGISRLLPDSGQVQNFGPRDGTVIGGYFIGSSHATADRRRLYFGGLSGLTVFAPEHIRSNPFAPPVVLTDLRLFNEPVRPRPMQDDSPLQVAIEYTEQLRLNHLQGVFSLEFAALNYAYPLRNKFAYKLEGFDKEWQLTDASRRFATYTNLPAGNYVFRVRASNKDAVWNDQGARLKIAVLPPPWRSWWAYALYLLMLAGVSGRWWWTRREKRRAEARYHHAVRASEERLKLALWGSGDGLWDWDLRTDRVHRKGLEFLGYQEDELSADVNTMERLIHPDERNAVMERMERLRRGMDTGYEAEFRVRTKSGQWMWVLDRGKVVESDPVTGQVTRIAGTLKNDQARKETEQALVRLAKYDTLTGLPNRAMFQDRLHVALSQSRRLNSRLALLFIDLDHFKHINDSLGHGVGDSLLKEVGRRVRSHLREGDMVARLGGDEFTVILEGIFNANEVASLARKLLELFAEPVLAAGNELSITSSIGISLFPDDGDDVETLLQHADTAMYCAKEAGRNSFQFYTAAMNQSVVRRMAMESGLRKAIERAELSLEYQPKLDLATGRMIGAEALARWDSGLLGPIAPTEFIPVAEDSGLIISIGDWLLHHACAQFMQWKQQGVPPFTLSVNLSARQLMRENLSGEIARVLRDTGMPAEYLELELTETTLMTNAEQAARRLRRLKQLGIKIAIDDFGTGYSSLTYLRRFPIDVLKIDKSFVLDIASNADDATIVSAIIAMSHTLQLAVVAEGVETEEQLALLRYQGCDQVQGFLYSRPLAAERFAAFVLEHAGAAPADIADTPAASQVPLTRGL